MAANGAAVQAFRYQKNAKARACGHRLRILALMPWKGLPIGAIQSKRNCRKKFTMKSAE
jgi:hypothetical protein